MQHPSQDALGEVFFALCKTVDTPRSLACWLSYKYKSKDLIDMPVVPGASNASYDFSVDYLVTSFLSKQEGLDFGIDTKAVALQRFATAEEMCLATNLRIKNYTLRGVPLSDDPRAEDVISRIQRKIAFVLGPFSSSKALKYCKWGPGATRGATARNSTADIKHSTFPIQVTHGALKWLRAQIESDPHWFRGLTGQMPDGPYSTLPSLYELVDDNRVVTVPKNAKTDRTIAAEPTGNSFLQQGFGRFLRRQLRRVGIDLDNQEINQVWASLAHILGLATLDLSMASDTIARELIFLLLPLEWALFADDLRSKYGSIGDSPKVRYHKFSSMGNAFTFELETLIFWALASACTDITDPGGVVSVYGDDIIVTQRSSALVCTMISALGFKVNSEKSFTEGRFFESCGRHYFDGTDVTPVFQKRKLDKPTEYIRCANRIARWALRSGSDITMDPVVQPAWNAVRRCGLDKFPWTKKFVVPMGTEGDDGWLMPYAEWDREKTPRYCATRGLLCHLLKPKIQRRMAVPGALIALELRASYTRLSSTDSEPCYDMVTPRVEPRYAAKRGWVVPTEKRWASW